MLDSPDDTQIDAAVTDQPAPARRRRSASRPAGPPAPSGEGLDAAAAAGVGDAAPETAEADTPKRVRRARTKSQPTEEATQTQPAVDATQPAEAEAEPASLPPRRRRTVKADLAAGGEVAAGLEELAVAPRRSRTRAVKSETFGLAPDATAEQVLDSLASAIGSGAQAEADQQVPAAADEDSAPEAADGEVGDSEAPRRRRRRRGGRRRRRGSGETGSDQDADGEEDETEEALDAGAENEAADGVDQTEKSADGVSRRRRRRRRSGEDAGEDDDSLDVVVRVREPRRRAATSDDVTGIEGSTRMEAKKQRRREGRVAGRRRTPILSEAEFLARRESVDRKMLIRQAEEYTQIAVIEDGILVEHYVDRPSAASMIGNIYLGRIQNVLPSMEAAFVDIGRGRNAVLYAGEVDWDSFGVSGPEKLVENVFKSGQSVLVQVTKDPVGAKGARLTSHISIPGRYIVYSPGGHLSGISRKLPEGERRRLKGILDELIEPQASVIVRTAAEGASEEELVRDVNRLKAQWEVLAKKLDAPAPQLLYAEPDLTVRIVRDLFTEDFAELVVDGNSKSDDVHDNVEAYVKHVAPHLEDRLKRWDRSTSGDLFDAYRVHEQVAKALERKVFLPSGGSLIIDRTEAMTVIDVNTGKFTGTAGNLEATVTSNNLEAAEEIVRQLRLRDIGGIIVIDFIDMVLPANRELLLRRLVECLGRDRTRHQVAEVTSLGLVQMTRKKIGTGLAEAFTVTCETCKGRGYHVHDAPVPSQSPPDGGDREGSRSKRPARATKSTPKPAAQANPAAAESAEPAASKPAVRRRTSASKKAAPPEPDVGATTGLAEPVASPAAQVEPAAEPAGE